jgi:Zn-finger nucleic acid-binding protein
MAPTMSCPKCDAPLVRVTTDHAVFWRCESCRGTAIGVDALRRTFARYQINALWCRAREAQGSPAAACPSCRNQMIEVAATDRPEPRIEVCRICHFLWFDVDELAALTPLPPKVQTEPPELPAEARQAIAVAEVELINRRAERDEVAEEFWWQLVRLLSLPLR